MYMESLEIRAIAIPLSAVPIYYPSWYIDIFFRIEIQNIL